MAIPQGTSNPAEYVKLPKNLLDAIGEIELTGGGPANRWVGGIEWQPLACRDLSIQSFADVCAVLESLDPGVYDCGDSVTQTAFRVFDAMRASALQWSSDDVSVMLNETLPNQVSHYFAQELIGGAAGSTMSLANEATAPADVPFNTAVSVTRALAAMENELAARLHGVQGTIHMPPGLIAHAVMDYGLVDAGDYWRTPIGNKVITDTGYVNAVAPSGQTPATVAQDWIYASGPVTYKRTPIVEKDAGGTFDLPVNRIAQWMEVYGILKFDPCPVTAVLVTYA